MDNKSQTLKYKIAVSGAAETEFMPPDALPRAEMIGRAIARHGLVTVTGATTGAPYWAAKGAKAEGGLVIGISPASTKREHEKTYGLPTEYHDLIIYTGFGYSGRNLLFTRAADAVITVAGRIGTLNEFTDAFEDKKPQGVLLHAGGTTNLAEEILKEAHRGMGKVVFDSDPESLVKKVLAMIEKEEQEREIE
ncbi:MAG: LOG family protein [Patescibacteria group bacterium]|nr:LOG family protein [Patescibacteria group bacterium]